jgi:hypothetical protein
MGSGRPWDSWESLAVAAVGKTERIAVVVVVVVVAAAAAEGDVDLCRLSGCCCLRLAGGMQQRPLIESCVVGDLDR